MRRTFEARQFIREVNVLKALPRLIWTSYLGEIRHELSLAQFGE
jgi:hypothetical protein